MGYDAVIHVDTDAPGPTHDGTTWQQAFTTLDEALALAMPGCTIRIADGTYTPSTAGLVDEREATFQLVSGVRLEGGYGGHGDPKPDHRSTTLNKTVLSGDLDADDESGGDSSENCYHVVTGTGVDSTAVIDGVTITGGNANGSYAAQHGGGLYAVGGAPTVSHCRFSGNNAVARGGAIHGGGGAVSIRHCDISHNTASEGGGVSDCDGLIAFTNIADNDAWHAGGGLHGCDGTIEKCVISGNRSDWGGGLCDCDGTVARCTISTNQAGITGGGAENCDGSFYRCSVTANEAGANGGGLADCDADIRDCVIEDNLAGGSGGGLRACDGLIVNSVIVGNRSDWEGAGLADCGGAVVDCVISDNSTLRRGGGLANCGGTIVGCSVFRNTAGTTGGGLDQCHAIVTNCLVAGNRADRGGGMNDCDGAIRNCTIVENWSFTNGGGLRGCNNLPGNCIVWANVKGDPFATVLDQIVDSSALVNSCVQDLDPDDDLVYPGPGNIDDPPSFAAGGAWEWNGATFVWRRGAYHLRGESPCIDSASNPVVAADEADLDGDGDRSEPTPFDLVGGDRFVDAPCTPDSGVNTSPETLATVDIGAIEFLPGDVDGSGTVDLADFAYFQTCRSDVAGGQEPLSPECIVLDFDCDNDVDLDDFGAFASSMIPAP